MAAGKIRRLMVWMPPQHGKSELISHHFPSWYLGKFPSRRVALAAYAADFAEEWGRKNRELVAENSRLLSGVKVSKASAAAKKWQLDGERGGMMSVGIGGPLTGFAVDLGIIDDPVKNAQEAFSSATRERHKNWFRSVMANRLSAFGAIIIVQTRWHEDDLSGWLLREQPGEWTVLCLPARAYDPAELPERERLAYKGDPLGRAPGEPLCPQLKPDWFLTELEKTSGAYFWGAMFQQRPTPLAGGIFKREWFSSRWASEHLPIAWDPEKEQWAYPRAGQVFEDIIQSWDFPFKATEDGSFCVGQVWARFRGLYYLLDQYRERTDVPGMIAAVKKMTHKWPMTKAKLLELKAAGPQVMKNLKGKIPGLIGVDPKGDKTARAAGITYLFESGEVLVPTEASAPWVEDYIQEMTSFPNAPFNDVVDTTDQALDYLTRSTATGKIRVASRATNWRSVQF